MKGFPKHFNTKFDVEYCLTKYPDATKEFLSQQVAESKRWMIAGKLRDGKDAGVESKSQKVVEIKDEITGEVKERYQYEYKDDPNSKLSRLGFTVKEANSFLEVLGNKEA